MPNRHQDVIGAGFLLSQIGFHASASYAKRIAQFGLTPPHVGLLRWIAVNPGKSQQTLAETFGMLPSRIVGLLDELETAGYVERRRDPSDRRAHNMYVAPAGDAMLQQLIAVARDAEKALLGSLTSAERKQLTDLLTRVAADQGLTHGVHPGYGRLRGPRVTNDT